MFKLYKYADNIGSKIVVRETPRCANCMSDKWRFLRQKPNRKLVGIISILHFLSTSRSKTCPHIVWSANK